jgi:hypothetical protein
VRLLRQQPASTSPAVRARTAPHRTTPHRPLARIATRLHSRRVTMTRNGGENVGRHGSTESSASWRSVRSNDTVRPFGRANSRGTLVTVQTHRDLIHHHQYVPELSSRCTCDDLSVCVGGLRALGASRKCAECALLVVWWCRRASATRPP